jgi:arylsulfatase A-like enzyme
MPAHTDSRDSLPGLLILSIGVVLAVLLIEWFWVAGFGLQLKQGEIAHALQVLVLAALAVGAGGWLIAIASGRWLDRAAVALAAPVAGLLFVDLFFALGYSPVARYLGAGAFVLVVFPALLRVIQKGPAWLRSAANWWVLAAALAALAVLLTALHAVDSVGTWLAVAAAVVAIALLLQGWRAGNALWPVLAVATLLAAAVVLGARVPLLEPVNNFAEGKPSVLLVTIDTLRADHVGAYGYAKASTPNLDALAREGILFRHAVATNINTGPSHASILTGLYPEAHGVLVNKLRLPRAVPTLADVLRDEGYVTAAFVSSYTTQDIACGLPSRFQTYDDDLRTIRWLPEQAQRIGTVKLLLRVATALGLYNGEPNQSYRVAEDTADKAEAWLASNGGRPFFLWTHFFDPHLPYHPPLEFRTGPDRGIRGNWYDFDAARRAEIIESAEMMEAMIDLYDAEVAYADAELGRILEAARAASPDGNLLIVVTSDHGESMGEHDTYWRRDMYDSSLLVPLVIVPPPVAGITGHTVDAQVSSVDLVPTILAMLDVESATDFDGFSLTGLIDGSDSRGSGAAFSSMYVIPGQYDRERHAVREEGWKLIRNPPGWYSGGGKYTNETSLELYNLSSDAAELNDLADIETGKRAALETSLNSMNFSGQELDIQLTPEEHERLRGLGYVR